MLSVDGVGCLIVLIVVYYFGVVVSTAPQDAPILVILEHRVSTFVVEVSVDDSCVNMSKVMNFMFCILVLIQDLIIRLNEKKASFNHENVFKLRFFEYYNSYCPIPFRQH